MVPLLGSTRTSLTPRNEPSAPEALAKVAPPSVDFQTPKATATGGFEVAPPLDTALTPRTARAIAARIEPSGAMARLPTAPPWNCPLPGSSGQLVPPSVGL